MQSMYIYYSHTPLVQGCFEANLTYVDFNIDIIDK